jgi:hypothetical protein
LYLVLDVWFSMSGDATDRALEPNRDKFGLWMKGKQLET